MMNSGYNSGSQGPSMESVWNNTPVAQSSAEVRLNFIRKTYLLFSPVFLPPLSAA
jgi:hypothetical protein